MYFLELFLAYFQSQGERHDCIAEKIFLGPVRGPCIPLSRAAAARCPIDVGMGSSCWCPLTSVAVLGNMLPVPIILLFAKRVLLWCTTWPEALGRFFTKIYEKASRPAIKCRKSAGRGIYWALYPFVPSPLPGTGAWTAAWRHAVGFWSSGPAWRPCWRRHDRGAHHAAGVHGPVRRSACCLRENPPRLAGVRKTVTKKQRRDESGRAFCLMWIVALRRRMQSSARNIYPAVLRKYASLPL